MKPDVDIPLTSRNYHLNSRFRPHIPEFAKECEGRVLDIGVGTRPHCTHFDVDEYIGLDLTDTAKDVDILATGTDLPFSDDSVDHVVSFQVLEHVPNPFSFVSEVERVLRPGGSAFISTNQMYPVHEAPHDYFRFTQYGLRELATMSHLEIRDIIEIGSLPMRMCCEMNYSIASRVRNSIARPLIALSNVLWSPVIDLNPRDDFISITLIADSPTK